MSNIEINTENEPKLGEQLNLEEGIDLLKSRKLNFEDSNSADDIGRLDVAQMNKVMFSIDMSTNEVKQVQMDQSMINNSMMDKAFFEGEESMMEEGNGGEEKDGNNQGGFNLGNDLLAFEQNLVPKENVSNNGKLSVPGHSLTTVNTNLVGWVQKQTQQKDGSKAFLNLVNSMKSSDTRIMTLNEAMKTIVFINKGTDTKKINFADIINIFLASRDHKHDIVIETNQDFVYLDIMASENGLSNINTVQGWYLAFKSTSLADKTNYDVYKQTNLNIEDLKVYKFSAEKIATIMAMNPDDKKKTIQDLADKLFDQYKVNESINKNQFFKCIKLISNNIFTHKEIDMIFADLIKRSHSSSINEESFINQTSEMISLIISKISSSQKK